MQAAIAGVLSATEPFIQDQDSLHNPLGLVLNFAMVAVAAFLCGAVIFLSV
jgi:cytochrome b